jgi:type I restriction enzyme, S subunit
MNRDRTSTIINSQLNEGYKQTEVGIIPEDWDIDIFQNVATLERGKFTARPRNDPKYYGGDIPFIQTGDVANSNGKITTFSQTLNQAGLNVSKLFPAGTLFFTIAANIGDVGFASFDTACPDSLMAIKAAKNTNKYWLYQELKSRKKSFENLATNNAQLNINLEKLRPYLLPIPPLAEQEAIAHTLSDIDALIESLDRLLTKKRQIKQGAMQELLRSKEGWIERRLGDITHIQTGSRNNQDKVEDGEYPLFVRSSTVERINTYSYDCEAILIPGEGGIGSIFHYINGRFDAHQRVYVIRQFSEEISGKYVYLYMSKEFGFHAMQNSVKATVDSLRLPTFQNFQIFVPPTLEEQIEIANILSDMDAEINSIESKLAKTRQLKQGMMHELLTGRIRLV